MASLITSAGSASGMNFESIISATLELKRAQLEKQTTTKKEEANIELSGVGKLKDALKTFQNSLKDLSSAEGFNTRKVTTNQPTDNPYFTVTTKDDASNGSYDIAVKQLATTEKVSQTFGKDDKIGPGTLKLTVQVAKTNDDGTTTYEGKDLSIDIKEDISVSQLRRMINDQAGDYGINASIVETVDGQKLSIDTGNYGKYDSTTNGGKPLFTMEYTAASGTTSAIGDKLNYGGSLGAQTDPISGNLMSGSWNVSRGQDAEISVDGETVTSSTNTFEGKISGLDITVNRVTANADKPGEFKSYQVDVTQDTDAITNKVQNFLNSYNTLMSTMNSLSKRNTYTDGSNNYDGGELAGDSQISSLQRQLQSMMTSITYGNVDAYSMGFKVDNDGVFSLDATKFKEGIKDNFNSVVNMFSAAFKEETVVDPSTGSSSTKVSGGLISRLDNLINDYTKSSGFLDQRTQTLNKTIADYEDKEAENKLYLEQYEENLRAKYATLDTTIANYNNSLFYLQAVLG